MRRRFPRHTPNSAGFTLIELLVVIVILGILMAVAVPTYLRQQSKAQDSRTQQYLTTAYKAIRTGTPDNGNQYPSSTSIVSLVQQSEPELTVQRSSCFAGTAAAPADAVLVDPSSSANSLLLCARSASGNVWELSATATSAPTLINGTLVPLTFSGNEITDTVRTAGVSGDFLPTGSGMGIWHGTTNSEAQPWDPATSGYTDAETSGKASWQSNAGIDIRGQMAASRYYTSTSYRVNDKDWTGLLPDTTYVLSAWVKANDGVYGRIKVGAMVYTPTDTWQRVYGTGTTDASGAISLGFHTWTDPNVDVLISGVQMEVGTYPTPLVTGARGDAEVQAPATLIGQTSTLWFAERFVISSTDDTANHYLAYLTVPGGLSIYLVRTQGGPNRVWEMQQSAVGGIGWTDNTNPAGTTHTVIGYVTPTQFGVSLDGGAFKTASRTSGTGLVPTGLSIGSAGATQQLDGRVYWFATGTGTLNNTDAATIGSWGNTGPTRASFPSSAQVTMTWDGTSSTGSLK